MRLRIAYLLTDQGIPYLGTKGASNHARAITTALCELGHDVTCYAASVGHASPAPSGPKLKQVSLDPFVADLCDAVVSRSASCGVAAPPDRELMGTGLNDAFRRSVQEDHELRPFDLIVERHSLWSFAGAWLSRDFGLPLAIELNAPLLEEQIQHRSLTLRPLAEAIRQQSFRTAAAILAVSTEVAETALRAGVSPDRVHVIPNGYDPLLFRPADSADASDSRDIGFLGTLKPWHGIEVLCEAFQQLAADEPAARLVLVGEGPMRGWVEAFRDRVGLKDRIELRGAHPHAKIPDLLRQFAVAVAPYPDSDDFYFSPLKLYEYMGSGLPIVASRVGQVAEVLEDEVTGLLVPPGDPAALAEALHRLTRDPELRARLGSAAHHEALNQHRWQDVAERTLGILAQCRTHPDMPGQGGMARRSADRVAYVLKRYPRLSETFIVTELLGVERTGEHVSVFATSSPKEDRVHPAVGAVRADVSYMKKPARRSYRNKPERHEKLAGGEPGVYQELRSEALGKDSAELEFAQAGWLAHELRRAGIGHVHAHFATQAARIARRAARLAGVSYSFTAHAKDIFRTDIDHAELQGLLDDCAFVVAISEYHERYLRQLHGSVRIEIVRNGLDLERFPWNGDRPSSPRPIRIVAVGRLVEKKGFDDLVRACGILKERGLDFECRLVGEGDERAALELLIAELGLVQDVLLEGACTQDRLQAYLQWASMLVAPCVTTESGDKDGLPTVLIEAMAVGLPVIATPVTAIPELVIDGETGRLVPERAPDTLAMSIVELADDPARCRELAKAARTAVEKFHDHRRNTACLAGLFREAAPCD